MATRFEILVNGRPLSPPKFETADKPDSAVNQFLVRVYGSVLSSRAPYNISATRPSDWIGEFQPIATHAAADGSEELVPLPDEPKARGRARRIERE